MTSRERWTVYPLFFLAIGLGLNANIQNQADHQSFDGKLVHGIKLDGEVVHGSKLDGDVVMCKELVVVNESGKPVVAVTANKNGAGILEARNANGVVQVVLAADSAGGVLKVLDATGRYYQFPPFERRPTPLLPPGAANPSGEQPAAKDNKAEN